MLHSFNIRQDIRLFLRGSLFFVNVRDHCRFLFPVTVNLQISRATVRENNKTYHPACTGFIQAGLSKIQGNLKDFHTVFQGLKFMKNTDLSVKILLQKC